MKVIVIPCHAAGNGDPIPTSTVVSGNVQMIMSFESIVIVYTPAFHRSLKRFGRAVLSMNVIRPTEILKQEGIN